MSIINELDYHCAINKCDGLLQSIGNPTPYDWATQYTCVTCGSNVFIFTECNNSTHQKSRRLKNRFPRHRISRHNKIRHESDAVEINKRQKLDDSELCKVNNIHDDIIPSGDSIEM